MTGVLIALFTLDPISNHVQVRFFYSIIQKYPNIDRVMLQINKFTCTDGGSVDDGSSVMWYSEDYANEIKNESARNFISEAYRHVEQENLQSILLYFTR
ncbi:unnamed protein product [Caenorhabditis brenneri]